MTIRTASHLKILASAGTLACALALTAPAGARECILDTNEDGTATAGVDSVEGANGLGNAYPTNLACGPNASAGGTYGGTDATAIGAGASVQEGRSDTSITLFYPGNRGTAVGASSTAAGPDTTALGAYSHARDFGATAVGSSAMAQRSGTAVGYDSNANEHAVALGREANASSMYAVAVGTQAQAQGNRSTALGYQASATANQSMALGAGSSATATGAMGLGGFSSARGDFSTAIGYTAYAPSAYATAIGYRAQAQAENTTAIGNNAQARHTGSTAIGQNAVTTANNQVTLGGTGSSVRVGDIAASTAAQVGPVQAVTVDSNGTLGTTSVATTAALNEVSGRMMNALAVTEDQFAMLDSRVGLLQSRLDGMERETRGGIAAAMALGGTMVVPDSNVSFSFNLATYRGEQGYSGTVVARVAPKVYISGGFAGSSAKRSNGGRVGVAFGM